MSIILFACALLYFVLTGRRHRPPDTRETSPYVDPPVVSEGRNGEQPEGDPVVG
jgi:hypothetical protein